MAWLDGLKLPDEQQIAWENANQGPYGDMLAECAHRDADGFRFGAYEFS